MAERKLSDGERINAVQNAFIEKLNQVLDFIPGYRGYRKGVENVVNMAQGNPSNYSATDYARDLGYSMVPFYGAYDNAINDQPQDWKGNALEAAMIALPLHGNLRAIVGRDGKTRYVADEIVKADPIKTAEFDRVSRAQTEPYRDRGIPVREVDGPYYHTPELDQMRLLNQEHPFVYPSEYVDVYGDEITRSYSNKSLNPTNINRTVYDYNEGEGWNKPLIEYGSEEWNNAQRAADEYKQFVNDNFNDRSSYIGHGQLGVNELGEPTVYSEAHRTPFEIYSDYMNNHQFIESEFPQWKLDDPNMYNRDLIRNQFIYNNTYETRNLDDYLRANNDALRLSDYKNIVRSITEPVTIDRHVNVINSKIDKLSGDLLTETDKEAMKAEVNRLLPLIDNEPDYNTRNRLVNELINNLKALGLDYADF